MDAPSGYNLPRRKSRLRSRDLETPRRPASPDLEPTPEPPSADLDGEPTPAPELPVESAPETAAAPVAEPAVSEEDSDELPAAFRLNKIYAERPALNPFRDWRWLLLLAALLGGGLLGGYQWGRSSVPRDSLGLRAAREAAASARIAPSTLPAWTQADVDAAFAATKAGRYPEARERFNNLARAHPEWPSMPVEVSRAHLYEHDPQEAQRILTALTLNRALPDADFMLALVHLTNREYALAETSFANAVALDPARPDFFYFWGECLRRDGKPREAVDRFRSALLRNQYENAEGLYQLKLWLSEIQADQEKNGADEAIDKALAGPRPSYESLFAAAAREIKAKRYKEAGDFIARAAAITEPSVFRVILQDPTFLEESSRPGIAPFYK